MFFVISTPRGYPVRSTTFGNHAVTEVAQQSLAEYAYRSERPDSMHGEEEEKKTKSKEATFIPHTS